MDFSATFLWSVNWQNNAIHTQKRKKIAHAKHGNMGANKVTPPFFLVAFVSFFFVCLYLFDYLEKREMKMKKKWSDSLVVLKWRCEQRMEMSKQQSDGNIFFLRRFIALTRDMTLTSIFRWRLHSRVCECATPYFVRILKITFFVWRRFCHFHLLVLPGWLLLIGEGCSHVWCTLIAKQIHIQQTE